MTCPSLHFRALCLFAALAFLQSFAACSGDKGGLVGGTVAWSELERFESVLSEVSGLMESGRTGEAMQSRRQLLEAGWAVNLQTLPREANDGERPRQLIGDLVSKLNRLAVPEIEAVVLFEVITGMETVVAELKRECGNGEGN